MSNIYEGYWVSLVFTVGLQKIAYSLNELLKKDAFLWNTEAQTAFVNLKKAMIEAHVYNYPILINL